MISCSNISNNHNILCLNIQTRRYKEINITISITGNNHISRLFLALIGTSKHFNISCMNTFSIAL